MKRLTVLLPLLALSACGTAGATVDHGGTPRERPAVHAPAAHVPARHRPPSHGPVIRHQIRQTGPYAHHADLSYGTLGDGIYTLD